MDVVGGEATDLRMYAKRVVSAVPWFAVVALIAFLMWASRNSGAEETVIRETIRCVWTDDVCRYDRSEDLAVRLCKETYENDGNPKDTRFYQVRVRTELVDNLEVREPERVETERYHCENYWE